MRSIPLARSGHVAVWTGAEMLVWGGILSAEITGKTGGRYDPATDTWHPISGIGDPTGRTGPTGVWSGAELIVWGGWGGGFTDNVFNSGGRYDPLLDLWTPTSTGTAVPTPRIGHSAVWTGTAMLIWGGDSRGLGGQRSDGALYDPVLDQWTAINGAGAPSARVGHSAVWADTEMIVWGGTGGSTPLDTGGRYDPAQEQWTDLPTDGAPEARNLQTAIWSGSELIVWGGCTISSGCFSPTNSGGRFDPAQNQWQATSLTDAPVGRRFHSAIWTGDEMIVWGGCVDHDCSDHRSSGGRYDPAGDAWVATQTTGPPFGRSMHTAVWTGAEMIVWGGCSGGECQNSTASGGRFDPVQNLWNPTSAEDAPSRRINHTAVWTGAEMIVWGGFDPLGGTASGKRYDPATDHWTGTSSSGAPFARDAHSAVWTGTEMIVWGGRVNGIGAHNSGGRYDPVLDTWADTDMTGAPQGRDFHPAVWTGTEMIVWGGCSDGGCGAGLDNGGRYDPVQDLWQPTPASGAPSARAFHSAIWTGSAMLVWGGCDATCSNPLASGASYVPGQTSWTTLPAADAPAARQSHTAVWTGAEMIVWGGRAGATVLGDGGAFAPVGAWRTINPLEAPGPRYNHDAVWSGAEMMVWGGCADLFCSALEFSGGRYAPLADTWSATSTGPFTPFSRSSHTMVAAGDEVLVWGGWRGMSSALTNTGASYCASGGAEVVAGAGVGGGSLLRRVAVR
jgi:N-acetylneuraminic acid mutarotase